MIEYAVLFVDDEPITRRMSSRLIGRRFRVLEADSGEQALAVLDAHEDEIGVVITDMKMSGMDGMALINAIGTSRPHIPIIASTGDVTTYDFASLIGSGIVFSAIEKPWDINAAMRLIDAAFRLRNELDQPDG